MAARSMFIDVIGDKTSDRQGLSCCRRSCGTSTPVYAAMIDDLKADTFGTKSYSISLDDNSIKLLKTKQIPDDVWAEI